MNTLRKTFLDFSEKFIKKLHKSVIESQKGYPYF
jgi:hypothetical protein